MSKNERQVNAGDKRNNRKQKVGGGDSVFNVIISRNFLRKFRKNQEVSMSKIEISKSSAFSLLEIIVYMLESRK